MTEITLTGLPTGWCRAIERLVTRRGGLRPVRLFSVAALVEHPTLGGVLIDTGYAPRVLAASRRWPYRLYRWATPMTAPPALAAVAQTATRTERVAAVVLTHLHADHVAGVLDFPDARLLAPRRAWPERSLRGVAAVRRAILPDLLPPELDARVEPFDPADGGAVDCGALGTGLDLFGDGSMVAVDLPGHARGQIGVVVHDRYRGPALVAADALWDRRALTGGAPSRLTHGIADDARAQAETVDRIWAWQRATGGAVLPTHDLGAWQAWDDALLAMYR